MRTFGLRYLLRDVEGDPGSGGAAAAVIDDPGQGGDGSELAAPEPRPSEKRFAELRESLKAPDDSDEGGKTADASDDPKKPAAEGKSPGPVRTPKEPAADKDGDKPKASDEPKPKADKAKDGDKTDDAPEPIKVALPARQKGQPDLEFELPRAPLEEAGVDVDELLERVSQLRKMGLRAQELLPAREDLAARQAELDEVEAELDADPVSFIVSRIEQPALQEKIVERLLTSLDEDAFTRILAIADRLAKDPVKRENERLKQERADRDRREDRTRDTGERKASLAAARRIGEQIVTVMEEVGVDGDDPRAERFFDYAMSSLGRHITKNKIENLDPSTVPELLEQLGVLQDFGLKRGTRSADTPKPKDEKTKGDGKQKDPRERDRRRREAATAPGGDGAPALGGERPPKGHNHGQRMGWLRERLGLPKKR